MNVTDLYITLRVEQSVVSQHLSVMRKNKVVIAKRQGQQIFYSLNQERLVLLNSVLAELMPFYNYPKNMETREKLYNFYFFHIAYEINHALYHPARIQILDFMDKNPNSSVQQIYQGLKFDQSPTSQQLQKLRIVKLISAERNGKQIIYSINYSLLQAYIEAIKFIFPLEN